MSHHRDDVYVELEAERLAQDAKRGPQHHLPNGRVSLDDAVAMNCARVHCFQADIDGTLTWRDIFRAEALGVMSTADVTNLRQELVQVAAVAVAWVEAIDRAAVRCTCTLACIPAGLAAGQTCRLSEESTP